MAVPKHPITQSWVKQTLIPFLLYAFASTLSYSADISGQVQSAVDFCLQKPDHPSDGDDLVFERIFMAIMHRYKNLEPDLEMVVDNIAPLARYLIRRAQLKGPYELLERTDIGSGAWVLYEQQRLERIILLEPEKAKDELHPPMRPPRVSQKPLLTNDDLDPRLVYAQPGHFAAANIPKQLTPAEDAYYRRQNHELEQYRLRRQQQQRPDPAAAENLSNSLYTLPKRNLPNVMATYNLSHQRTPAPTSLYTQQDAQRHGVTMPQTLPAPQDHPQSQALQLPKPPSMDSTLEQRLPTQLRPAHQSSAHQQPTLEQILHRLETYHHPTQSDQNPWHYPRTPTSLFPHPPPHTTSLSSHLTPLNHHSHKLPNPRPSSTSAHSRGTICSTAAQQRAREIAAKVSAYERDTMARDIMQRSRMAVQTPGPRSEVVARGELRADTGDSFVWPESGFACGEALGGSINESSGNGGVVAGSLPTLEEVYGQLVSQSALLRTDL
ncbi:hypothetical protein EJ07DRAFT_159019 [Lizonia empirigonia]|nr:hypothetical protein EJ07DRAFT_159019 [Lizonia empirigonia]